MMNQYEKLVCNLAEPGFCIAEIKENFVQL